MACRNFSLLDIDFEDVFPGIENLNRKTRTEAESLAFYTMTHTFERPTPTQEFKIPKEAWDWD